ncbi:CHAT domain-containing protein [Streptomyces sp. NPDC057540]|uniref:CHAT domain-containing protein n=1 Tax=Streptomyces sp. NPDC057540 TaxID=3346160 RepID=UPI003690EC11
MSRRPDEFDEAVALLDEAVRSTAPDDPGLSGRLTLLSSALRHRYQAHRDLSDLDRAVERCQEALLLALDDASGRTGLLISLGGLLELRAFRTGDAQDAEASVDAYESAAAHCPVDSPDHGRLLHGLGMALLTRYECTGRPQDIDTAVERLSEAVAHEPGGVALADRLARLAWALRLRYGRTEERADLEAAGGYAYTAFTMTPSTDPAHPDRACDLGGFMLDHHRRTGDPEFLKTGIGLLEQAAAAGTNRTVALHHLGAALHRRYDAHGLPADLDRAVAALTAAVRTADPGSMSRLASRAGLATALHARALRPGAESADADLDRAADHLEAVLDALPAGRPAVATSASILAGVLSDRHARGGAADDRAGAILWGVRAWEEEGADADIRITAALVVARMLAAEDPDRAADLAEGAIGLLPRLASLYANRADRQAMLSRLGGSAGTAAALVLGAPRGTARQRAERAFLVLESGRSVLLGHALGTRGDLAELSRTEPGLVARFKDVRARVENPVPDGFPPVGSSEIAAEADRRARTAGEQRRRAAELADLTQQVRARLGGFGKPPTPDEARAEAAEGAVVMLNVSALRSDALLLTREDITSVELTALVPEAIGENVSAFRTAVDTVATTEDFEELATAQDAMASVLEWLWDCVAEPVLTALGHTERPGDGEPWPRLWWAPGGVLGMLPLHAAGHRTGPTGRRVLDRVISSYTPTLRALRHAREQVRRQGTGPVAHRALLVAMPLTPGLPGGGPLSQALEEVARVRHHFDEAVLLCNPEVPTDPPADGAAIRSEVLASLSGVTVAHFACHGAASTADPSQSRLLLHDHQHSPLTVQDLLPAELDSARLAYLSACGSASATVGGGLRDEAIHLASVFQLVGFPHVVGSLWDIDDRTAATLADAFYAALRTGSAPPDTDRAAWALHQAVRGIRDGTDLPGPYDRTRNPYLWASYLHAGA